MRSLVTGATSGLGAAFARALAARGSDLVIVARDEERLAATAAELRTAHGVTVDVLRADLSVDADLRAVAAELENSERPIDLLVNNAGFGLHTRLTDPDVAVHRNAIDVMCYAVLVLGGAAGRAMRARGHGRIINISSLASWTTQGHYSAVKAWVRAYSESLSNELHGSGVTVTAACPGWVRTEFHERAGIRTSALPDWIWQDADPVVAEILADAERGKVLSVPGLQWKITRIVLKLAPAAAVRAVSRALVRSRD
ncbi:MAG: SDR family NAD(P)-dependent oxidoreductase [Propionicimonas sp.]|uniref:SDR family NAD(P)-dependent oxidoreductase n=1 Tax=Propionicimonas sp. TaxID=1955623 RepID=UPI003D122E8F